MDKLTFHVGRQEYVAQLLLDEEHITVTMSVYKTGEEHSLFAIAWQPKDNWQRFMPSEEWISIGVVKRALKIWDNYRKTPASKKLHLRKPKPTPKAMQVVRKQMKEALDQRDDVRLDKLVAEFNRLSAKTRVPLAVA